MTEQNLEYDKILQSRELNEEKIKADVIIPFLKTLGINADQIEFETSFKMTLGRDNDITIPQEIFQKGGRLDILCKDNKKNYFIVEVKAENVQIDDEDIAQGVSYARAIHPIAPYVIVTNGKETKTVNSITKEEVQGELISEDGTTADLSFEISIDNGIFAQYETLKYFIGYTPHNISVFNKTHLRDRMASILGDDNNLNKKYVPSLYIDNPTATNQFDQFLASEAQVFGLVGEGGVGKTNTMCDWARTQANENIVLFFLGSEIYPDIQNSLRNEFNWVFSEGLDSQDIVDRLLKILPDDRKLIFFIDAIDEADGPSIKKEIDDFLRNTKRLRNLKVVLSCKTSVWQSFLVNKGNPSVIQQSLYSMDQEHNEEEAQSKRLGVSLVRVSKERVIALSEKYRSLFKFSGNLSGELVELCRLPFMMRIVAEVYAGRELPNHANDLELLDSYLELKYAKMDREKARNTIIATVERMIELSSDTRQGINEQALRKGLGLKPHEDIAHEVFDHYILTRHTSSTGATTINFYFSKVRDYITAIEIMDLPHRDGKDFESATMHLMKSQIGQSALGWYTKHATSSQREILLDSHLSRALLFLEEYSRLLNTHFPNLKNRIEPYTDGEIGIVMEEPSELGFFGYSLREFKSDSRIEIISGESRDQLDREYQRLGGYWWRMDTDNFMNDVPEDIAFREIMRNLDNAIIRGELNDLASKTLAFEIVVDMVKNYPIESGLEPADGKSRLTNVSKKLPLDFSRIKNGINLEYAKHHARNVVRNEKYKEGDYKVNQSGGTHLSFSQKDFERIQEVREEMHENDKNLPHPNYIHNYPQFDILKEAILTLESISQVIDKPFLPENDLDISSLNYELLRTTGNQNNSYVIRGLCYSQGQLLEYISALYTKYIEAYTEIIESNFEDVKEHFPFYNRLPCHVHIGVRTNQLDDTGVPIQGVYYYNMPENRVIVTMCDDDTFSIEHMKAGGKNAFGTWLQGILSSTDNVPLRGNTNLGYAGDSLIVRSMVYKQIKDDIKYVYGAIDPKN